MKSLTKWSPWGTQSYIDTDSLFSQMDNLFHDVFEEVMIPESGGSLSLFERVAYPRCDIREEPNQIVVDIEVPGLTKENVKVEVKNKILIVRGDKRQGNKLLEGNYLRSELKKSSFSRQICTLNKNCDVDKISAAFKDGILTVVIPKIENDLKPDPIKEIKIQ